MVKYAAIDVDALVLDDSELFENTPWTSLLEIFPERVTNSCEESNAESQARIFTELGETEDRNEGIEDEEDREFQRNLYAELPPSEFEQEMCRRYIYHTYQSVSIVTHIFVEDKRVQVGGKEAGLLHVYLDDRGNMVRQLREGP